MFWDLWNQIFSDIVCHAPAYFPLSQCVRRRLFQNVYLTVIVASNWKLVSSVPSFWLLSHARSLSSRSLWEEQIFIHPLRCNNVVAGNYSPLPLPRKNKPDNSTSMTFLFLNFTRPGYFCAKDCLGLVRIWSLGRSQQLFFCVFSHFRHGDEQ